MQIRHLMWFVLSVFSFSADAAALNSAWESLITKGNAALLEKNLDAAAQYYEQSVEAAAGVSELLAISNHDLGMIFQIRGNYGRAESYYSQAIQHWDKAQTRPPSLIASTYNNLGDVLTDKHQLVEAREMYEKSLAMSRTETDGKTSRVAFAMSKLASSYSLNGDTDRAEALLKEAIAMHRKSPDTDPADLATSLDCLAKIYAYQHRFQEAAPLFQESLSTVERVMGSGSITYAISLQNFATMYRLAGNADRAAPLLKKAVAIYEKTVGLRHPYMIMVWNELGLLALGDKKYSLAVSYMEKAHDVSSEAFGPAHLRTVLTKGNLALASVRAGKVAEGKRMMMEMLAAERDSNDIAPEEFARTLTNCAELAMLLHDSKEAERYYREAIPIWRRSPRSSESDLVAALQGYARALKAEHSPEVRQVEKEAKAFIEKKSR